METGSIPLREASRLYLLNIDCGDCGEGNEANTSATIWHQRSDYVNAAGQGQPRRKGAGGEYKGRVPYRSTCHANKSARQPCNWETKPRATKLLDRVFTGVKGSFSPSQFGEHRFALMFTDGFDRLKAVKIMTRKGQWLRLLEGFT